MIGITACFTGCLGKDAEIRNARDGAPWASFPVAVDPKPGDETAATWVRVAVFGNTVTPLTPRLIKGALVYCEGRMTLGTWTDRNGQAKSGLNLSAWQVVPMAQIGAAEAQGPTRGEREAVPSTMRSRFEAAGMTGVSSHGSGHGRASTKARRVGMQRSARPTLSRTRPMSSRRHASPLWPPLPQESIRTCSVQCSCPTVSKRGAGFPKRQRHGRCAGQWRDLAGYGRGLSA